MPQHCAAGAALALLLLLAACADAQRARGFGGGLSSRTFSAPTVSRPTTSFAPSVSRPSTSSFAPTTTAARAPTAAVRPPSFAPGGAAFGTLARPVRPPTVGGRSLALPLLLGGGTGLILGTALANSNANNRFNRCGNGQVCYEAVCNNALQNQCKGANSTLERVTCPSTPYTECYESLDKQFTCYGVARPTTASDIKAECFAGNSTDTNTAQSGVASTSGAAQQLPMAAAMMAAAVLCAAMLLV